MIGVVLRDPADGTGEAARRRRFGLDTPLPADPRVVERAVLRFLADRCPSVLVLTLGTAPAPEVAGQGIGLAAGVPDLLLLLPGGRLAWLKIKTQAQRLTRSQKAFADLCRERAIPFHIVRSLSEARALMDGLLAPSAPQQGGRDA